MPRFKPTLRLDDSLARNRDRIIQAIVANPVSKVQYINLGTSDADGSPRTCLYGISYREGVCDVWSYEPESHETLQWKDSFSAEIQAQTYIHRIAGERKKAVRERHLEHLDEVWEDRMISLIPPRAPFCFQDSILYHDGWVFGSAEDVYCFFRLNPILLTPKGWGRNYRCSLVDADELQCWVRENHRGLMVLEPGRA